MARAMSASAVAASAGVSRMRSRVASSCATSISRSSMLLRRTSVGCAVSTGLTTIASNSACSFARGPQPGERILQSAARRRPIPRLLAHQADAVLVLGDIGEMGKVAERAHHLDRAVVREAVKRRLQLPPVGGIALAPERDRDLADALHRCECGLALLLPVGVAQYAPGQPNVRRQRPFSVVKLDAGHWSSRFVQLSVAH